MMTVIKAIDRLGFRAVLFWGGLNLSMQIQNFSNTLTPATSRLPCGLDTPLKIKIKRNTAQDEQ